MHSKGIAYGVEYSHRLYCSIYVVWYSVLYSRMKCGTIQGNTLYSGIQFPKFVLYNTLCVVQFSTVSAIQCISEQNGTVHLYFIL